MVRREKCEQGGDLPNKTLVHLASDEEGADWQRTKGALNVRVRTAVSINKPR